MGKRTGPYPQKEITNAAAVAEFLGIPCSPWANSMRVAEVIQRRLDALQSENTLLRTANRLISSKYPEVAEQFDTVLERAKALGIDLHQLDQQVKSLGISLHLHLDSNKDCADSSPELNSATSNHTQAAQENPDWPTRTRGKSRKTGAAAKSRKSATPSRRSKQSKQREEAA
jgi:hypothetical protein